jgi:glycosyltransferase involved in cell wall biosynthesis
MLKRKILHITPHLGGGVGTVVKNWLLEELSDTENEHRIISLEVNKNPIDPRLNVLQGMYNEIEKIMFLINASDIVLIHWWNHPLLFDLIINHTWPDCRIVMWSLASCLFPPYVHSEKLLKFSDRFIFSSPVSYDTQEIKDLPAEQSIKIDVIWAAGDTSRYYGINKKSHEGFQVGTIIGSADYSKLNPAFATLCSKVTNQNIRFTIICSEAFAKQLASDIDKAGITERVELIPFVSDILPYLQTFDVFGYPLQPYHFGTCEVAIGEAMMAGIVPVVLNNPAERYIINHGVDGFIAESIEEYAGYIEYLYQNPDIRKTMAEAAIQSACKKYTLSEVIQKWRKEFKNIMDLPKSIKRWPVSYGLEKPVPGYMVFTEALGRYGKIFENKTESQEAIINLFQSNPQWCSENKGGVQQYLRYFTNDCYLREWVGLIK